ncbi:hypothetical protein EOL96_04165 [Candidatus Saccharibacteria bacterium]|nr:hypothetical protein [Candidatus Saccharibacteria bacterium]
MQFRNGNHWRHFRPPWRRRNRQAVRYRYRDRAQDAQHLVPKQSVQFVCNEVDAFDRAEQIVTHMLQRRPEVHDLDRDINRLRKKFERSKNSIDGLVALLAQTPRAVLAQLQMDVHPHGYRDKQSRLYELIDFNDTLVDTVQLLPDADRVRFAEATKIAADRICKRVGAPCFTNEQWNAIVRGLSREVAVYWAAVNTGFRAHLTTRAEDAFGVDMQIQDPETGRYINLDVKTPSAFRYRLEQLVKEGRMTPHEQVVADEQQYATILNGHAHKTPIILLCILPQTFGDLSAFRFVDEAPMRDCLNRLIRDHGMHDGMYGIVGAPR